MKRFTIKSLFAVLCLTMVPSCNFLEELPASNLVGEQVFESIEASQSALQGCYQSLLGLYGSHFLNYVQGASVLQHIQTNQQIDCNIGGENLPFLFQKGQNNGADCGHKTQDLTDDVGHRILSFPDRNVTCPL